MIFYTLHCAAAREIGRKSLYIDTVKLPALQTNVVCKVEVLYSYKNANLSKTICYEKTNFMLTNC